MGSAQDYQAQNRYSRIEKIGDGTPLVGKFRLGTNGKILIGMLAARVCNARNHQLCCAR